MDFEKSIIKVQINKKIRKKRAIFNFNFFVLPVKE